MNLACVCISGAVRARLNHIKPHSSSHFNRECGKKKADKGRHKPKLLPEGDPIWDMSKSLSFVHEAEQTCHNMIYKWLANNEGNWNLDYIDLGPDIPMTWGNSLIFFKRK